MDRSYLLSISLTSGLYRHIQISADATLARLYDCIHRAFDLPMDPGPHVFFMGQEFQDSEELFPSDVPGRDGTTKVTALDSLQLKKGKRFSLVLFLDGQMQFNGKVLQVLEGQATAEPVVVKKAGRLPQELMDHLASLDMSQSPEDTMPLPELWSFDRLTEEYLALGLPGELLEQLMVCFEAAARLYGILPMRDLHNLLLTYDVVLEQTDFLAVVELLRHVEGPFVILGEEEVFADGTAGDPMDRMLIHSPLMAISMDLFYQIYQIQQGRPMVTLPKKEFLDYADPNWLPSTPAARQMLAFLRQYLSRKEAGNLLGQLVVLIAQEMDSQVVMEFLGESKLRLKTMNDMNRFMELYGNLHNNTRLQSLRGYTPNEIRVMEDVRRTLRSPKGPLQ